MDLFLKDTVSIVLSVLLQEQLVAEDAGFLRQILELSFDRFIRIQIPELLHFY